MKHRFFLTLCAVLLLQHIIPAQPGTWRQVGDAGIWANTVFATAAIGNIYTIETSGTQYELIVL